MIRFTLSIACLFLFSACENRQSTHQQKKKSPTVVAKKQRPQPCVQLHTDTLQLIHFEGNFDYWSCVFLDSKKDTIRLVTDSAIANRFNNRLFEVKWFVDTLFEAGDNDSKYAARRMSHFRLLKGKPFVEGITEAKLLRDVSNLPELQSGAEQVVIAERPNEGRNYYLIETGNHEPDHYSRFAMFRVYTYPKYEIKVYDAANDREISLLEWRKISQK